MNTIASVSKEFSKIVNFYRFFNRSEKLKFNTIFFLLVLNSFLEIIGIAALIPLLNMLSNFENSKLIFFITDFETFNQLNKLELQLLVLSLFVLIITFKTFYSIILGYIQNKFVANFGYRISYILINELINRRLDYFIKRNSSYFIKLFQTEQNMLLNFTQALFIFLTETSIVLLISIGIIIYDPLAALLLLASVITSFIFYNLITKSRVKTWGELRQKNDDSLYRIINEIFIGMKEIKLNIPSDFLVFKLDKKFKIKARLHQNFSTFNSLPRYYYEFFLVVTVIIFFMILLMLGNDLSTMLILMTVFLASSFKIIPSLNRITSSTQTLKFTYPSIKLITSILTDRSDLVNSKPTKDIFFKRSISLKDIQLSYDNEIIISNLDFEINKGDKILILGKSGSGKTSLIDLISLIKSPTKGKVLYDGKKTDLNKYSYNIRNLKYVTQFPFFLDDTVLNNIHMNLKSEPNILFIKELINDLDLNDLIKNSGLNTLIGENAQKISGGQKQRLALVRALYNNPDFLVLDEFTSALDKETKEKVVKVLFEKYDHLTIVAVSHNNDLEKYFDHKLILK